MNAFDFTIEVQDGSKVELSKFKGKVLVIVNTATGCGFTPQYSKVDVNGDNAIPFYKWITENTCSKVISMDIDGDIVKNIEFMRRMQWKFKDDSVASGWMDSGSD